MVYLILALVAVALCAASFWAGAHWRRMTMPMTNAKQAVAALVALREVGQIDPEKANKMILDVRAEKRLSSKAAKNGAH